ncbi:MAG: nucleoside triphosphate pyrophosphohydrolase [Rhodospirillaceae bacterium]|jgi:nucleoside triphosphate diphosphatase|nr:nucleoside triphosphate pyrophosphohydrolase [Rhodospirillaceae bacterium]MBT7355613.1 nucleoside triphosphate pyrophosphohydrolase [Rhodospirillaceae bacterium]
MDTSKPGNIEHLIEIMALLRDPEKGCPWDVEQTFASIAPHTIEEAYEVADAIEQNDMAALTDELGDLLLQVVFHARMAEEDGIFSFDDVAGAICDKLVRRHPHVFSDTEIKTAEAQTSAWEEQKAQERQAKSGNDTPPSALDGVTIGLPALMRALKLQKRAARVGFDWHEAADVLDKFAEEIAEMEDEMENNGSPERLEDELGDLLFTCVNLARKLGIDPEVALRKGNAKFERRFKGVEALLAKDGKTPVESDLEEMDALWAIAKKQV